MTEEIVRATLIVLLERNHLDIWPTNEQIATITDEVEQLIGEVDDGQPSWEQEWQDFGETYD